MKAKKFDQKFDSGDDITQMLDLSNAKRPFHDQERIITTQNDEILSQNSRQYFNQIGAFRPYKWLNSIEPSLLNLGIISSLLGGLIFLIYFCDIKYFPELDSQSLLFFLAATTPLGFFLIFSLSIFLLFPGIMWTNCLDFDSVFNVSIYPLFSKNRIMILRNLVLEKIKISEENNYFLDKSYKFRREDYIFSPYNIAIIYIYTFFSGCLFIGICGFSRVKNTAIIKENYFDLTTKEVAFILLLIYLFMFVFMIFVIHKKYFKINGGLSVLQAVWISARLFGYSIFSCSWYLFVWLIISGYFSQSTDGANYLLPQNELFFVMFITFSSCLATSLIVVCRYPKKQTSFIFDLSIGFVVLLFLIFSLNKIAFVPKKIMNIYGWGNIDNASLVVDRTGCQAVESMNIKIDGSCLEKDRTYKIEGACILSSIGKNYYLRFPGCNLKKGDPRLVELALAKTNVISWSRQNLKNRVSTNPK
jgi:hypothetical protein